jgi:hypothetical protein
MTFIYKIKDTVTGKYWNGDARWSRFDDTGKSWKKREKAEQQIGYYLTYVKNFKKQDMEETAKKWEIVKVKITETPEDSYPIEQYLKERNVRCHLESIDRNIAYFYDTMRSKDVIDKIEFIIQLKKDKNSYWHDHSKTIEARAQLRNLGVKTRTFREHRGVFGMMDRQQAMRARLVLDVENVIDLAEIRKNCGL